MTALTARKTLVPHLQCLVEIGSMCGTPETRASSTRSTLCAARSTIYSADGNRLESSRAMVEQLARLRTVTTLMREISQKLVDSPWIERLARLGYAAKGVIYLTIGYLAIKALFGITDSDTDAQEALVAIATQPLGTLLLGAILVGLVGYVVWRLFQAWNDTERKGGSPVGIAQRLAYIGSALFYGGMAYSAFRILNGMYEYEGSRPEDWTARFMGYSYGVWLVGLAGVIMLGVGVEEIWRGLSSRFRREVREEEMGRRELRFFLWVGRLGLAARGVLYGLIGAFLVQAAIQYDPEEAGGLGEALAHLASTSLGPWLFGTAAMGLVAYGLFALAEARYRRFHGTRA